MRPGELSTFFVSQESKESVESILLYFLKDKEMVSQMSKNTDLVMTLQVVQCFD